MERGATRLLIRKLRESLYFSLVSLAFIGASVGQAVSNPFNLDTYIKTARDWAIGAITRDNAPLFPNSCVAIRNYQSGTRTVLFRSDYDGWGLAFFNSRWDTIQDGSGYDLRVRIDQEDWNFGFLGRVADGNYGLSVNNLSAQFVRAFTGGSQMDLIYRGNRLERIQLRGTTAAALAVEECFNQQRNRDRSVESGLSASAKAKGAFASLYDLIVFASDHPSSRVQAFEDGLDSNRTLKSMVNSGVVKSVHDCLVEFRDDCRNVITGSDPGSDYIAEWGEWRDAAFSDNGFKRSFVEDIISNSKIGGYTILSDDEIALYKSEHPYSVFELPYGSRAGMSMTIFDFGGIGTSEAWIELRHLWRNARAVCREYANDFSVDCVRRNVDDPYRGEISANCATRRLTDLSGIRYKLGGRSQDEFLEYEIVELASGERLEAATASGHAIKLEYFKALCPNLF